MPASASPEEPSLAGIYREKSKVRYGTKVGLPRLPYFTRGSVSFPELASYRRSKNGGAVEYKGINYQMLQSTGAQRWRWTVFLDAHSTKSGISRNRSVAILDALRAIQKAKQTARNANKSANEALRERLKQ
jgi:hypothetical protein